MKTIRRITALLIAMLAISLSAALFTACGGSHTCEFETTWTSDEENHWHKCKDADCTEISGKAAHTWDDGVEATAATVFAKGVKTFTCKDCGKTKTEETTPVTDSGAYFSALLASSQKMANCDNGYMSMTEREVIRDADNDGEEESYDYVASVTWNSEGKGAYKAVNQSTSSKGTETSTYYDLVDAVGDKYYLTEIASNKETFAINNKEYVSNDYYNTLYADEMEDSLENLILGESELKESFVYSIKSNACRNGFVFKANNQQVVITDIKDSDISYVCTVSSENAVAKIEATISFTADWLATVYVDNDGDSCDIKEFSMKACYEFTADGVNKFYQESTVKAVDESQKELSEYDYMGYDFEKAFKQSLFDDAKAVETACSAYEGTVEYHTVNIEVYINGVRDSGCGPVAYNDKAAAKTEIDGAVERVQISYRDGETALNVKAYLDKDCTVEYTEANKNDLELSCAFGGKIYLKVTPADENKTFVMYVYTMSYMGYTQTNTTRVIVDRTNEYAIETNSDGTNYNDEITVDGTVITGTTYDLTGKEFVVIRCTKKMG